MLLVTKKGCSSRKLAQHNMTLNHAQFAVVTEQSLYRLLHNVKNALCCIVKRCSKQAQNIHTAIAAKQVETANAQHTTQLSHA